MICVDQSCSFKLHTLKCARQEPAHVQENAVLKGNSQSGQSIGSKQDQHPVPPLHGQGETRGSDQTGKPNRPHTAVYGGVGQGQLYSIPPPNYAWARPGGHTVGYPAQKNQQHPSFQGLIVQQLLEAQTRYLEQELAKQREEVRIVQEHLRQQLLPYPVKESLVWGPRHSF